jgi:hypothetical protein
VITRSLFDIFSGLSPQDESALWLEAVEGFEQAQARMNDIAVSRPGCYFMLRLTDKQMFASVDTRKVNPLE